MTWSWLETNSTRMQIAHLSTICSNGFSNRPGQRGPCCTSHTWNIILHRFHLPILPNLFLWKAGERKATVSLWHGELNYSFCIVICSPCTLGRSFVDILYIFFSDFLKLRYFILMWVYQNLSFGRKLQKFKFFEFSHVSGPLMLKR